MKKFLLKKILPVTLSLTLIGGIFLPINTLAATGEINAVATSHLDTNWGWNLEETIDEYLPEVFEENSDLIKDNPDYKFNFEGAYRYELLKEYYPEKFEQLKDYIADGSWNISGTAYENGDVNIPSPEALFRNILYGNNFFLDNFSKTSKDIYLPDCFGFGYALPSIMAHSNLLGFSTQKLSWGNAFPNGQLPFDLGVWKGPDGKTAIADINLNSYWNAHTDGFRNNGDILNRLSRSPLGRVTALFGACGDRGGGASNLAVRSILSQQAQNSSQSVKVNMQTTDALMKSITEEDKKKLPSYDGEMVMKQHGTGSYTSKVMSKRWNRRAEQMAFAAELANVNSEYMNATEYPAKQFEEYWKRVISHQFHDDITGTSNSDIYLRSYNDLMLSVKQFANEYESGAAGVVSAMDTTSGSGELTLIVNNPLGVTRSGTVVGTVTLPEQSDEIKVVDGNGNETASQIISRDGNRCKIAFNATVKAMGYKKYIVQAVSDSSQESPLTITENSLSNEKYAVTIDKNGDISGIFDKELNKQLLSNPIRLGIFNNTDNYWAAWELKMEDYYNLTPQNYVGGAPTIEIVQNGPARVALKISRTYGKSKFQQTVSLSAGGKTVDVDNVVDWQETASILKAEFNLKPSNPNATYDLGLGTITRGNNTADKAEVPVQKWADLTNSDESYGVSILNDCKYGMDKYDDNTMRLTLIHTPKENYTHHSGFYPASGQSTQDLGENRFSYAIYGHEGNFADSEVQNLAEGFNQPLYAFSADKHEGALGSDYSFGELSNDKIIVRAVKKAEKSDEIIVRVGEGSGKAQKNVSLSLGSGIAGAREVYATEEEIGPAAVTNSKLVFDIGSYGVKTFAITLKPSGQKNTLDSAELKLPYNTDAYSGNENKGDSSMTYVKDAYPTELVSDTILSGGISYKTGGKTDGENNAVKAEGQKITLPSGYNTLHLLAASVNGDKEAVFKLGESDEKSIDIADFKENVAAWDIKSLGVSGYVKEQTPALVCTHSHQNSKDQTAKKSYMFSYELDITGAGSVTLPDDKDIIVFAATLTKDSGKKTSCISELHDKREIDRSDMPADISETITFDGANKSVLTNENFEEKSVSNTSCDFSTEQSFSKDTSLKLTGSDDSSSGGFTYYTIYSKPVKISKDTVLSYKFYAANELGRYTTVDMAFDSGMPLRDRDEAHDQNGVQMHPSKGRGTVGQWVDVECKLGEIAEGQTITRLMFAYDHTPDSGTFTSYIDDLKISAPTDSLEATVQECSKISAAGYGAASFAEFKNALLCAKDAVNGGDASSYENKTALENLNEAKNELTKTTDATKTVYGYNYAAYRGCANPDRDSQGVPYALGNIVDTTYVSYKALDFGKNGADVLRLSHSGKETSGDARVIVYNGATPAGEALGTLSLPATGDWEKYTYDVLKLKQKLVGEHDICLVFRSESTNTCNIKTMDFTLSKAYQTPISIKGGNLVKSYGDPAFSLATDGGLGTGALSYKFSNPQVAANAGAGKIALKSPGTTTVTAVKAADENYFETESEPITLTVNKSDIANCTVSRISDQSYTGNQIKPSVTVTSKNGDKLVLDRDYSLAFGANTNTGTAKVVISGKNGYEGSQTITFAVTPKKLSDVSLSKIKTQTYTGKPIVPAVSVSSKSAALKKGVDYRIDFKANKKPGKATVTVMGIGNYSFAKSASFNITPKAVSGLKLKARKKAVTVSYKKAVGANGYKISYAKSKKFKGAKSIVTTKRSRTFKKLKSGRRYYFRVAPFVKISGKKVYGKTCRPKSVKAK